MTRVAVLGAGAWGTALARCSPARHEVTLWARDPAQAEAMARTRRNERYLPGVELPPAGEGQRRLSRRCRQPRRWSRRRWPGCARCCRKAEEHAALVWLCKGFEEGTGLLPHEIVAQALGAGARCGALSGPSFAHEVARGLPSALTLAARDAGFAREAAALLHGGRMRVYTAPTWSASRSAAR